MSPRTLHRGEVVQLSPDTVSNPMFAGCFLVVDESKSFGCTGYVQSLGKDGKPGGSAFYRAGWGEMEPVGLAVWILER